MKSYNNFDMRGRLYDYSLETAEGNRGDVIRGSISLEVDAEGTVVEVRYYVNEMTNAGKKNRTYDVLDSILAGNYNTVVNDGDEASWLALSGSVSASYFKGRDGEAARSQKLRGSFVNDNKDHKYLNKWKVDYLFTKVTEVEADLEKKIDRFVKCEGYYVDSFFERIMAFNFDARSEAAINYLLAHVNPTQDTPYFVSVWGALTKTTRVVVKKNAFDEDETEEYSYLRWTLTGMSPNPYDMGDEANLGYDKYKEFKTNLDEYVNGQMNRNNDEGGSGKPALDF